jgi:hypothetical protein
MKWNIIKNKTMFRISSDELLVTSISFRIKPKDGIVLNEKLLGIFLFTTYY